MSFLNVFKIEQNLMGGGAPPPGVSPAEECSPLKNRDPGYTTLGVYFSEIFQKYGL